MKNNLISLLSTVFISVISPIAIACEPASLDWDALYNRNDINQDNFIDKTEWKSVIQLKDQPYQWENPTTADDPFRLKIFHAIDKNQDDKLSADELSDIYSHLPNPCANFPYQYVKPSLIHRFVNLFR